jgi:phage shock protein C
MEVIMVKIYRSRENKMIAGICGGIGEIANIDPTIIRLLFVLTALVTAIAPMVFTYIIGWIIIPLKPPSTPQ